MHSILEFAFEGPDLIRTSLGARHGNSTGMMGKPGMPVHTLDAAQVHGRLELLQKLATQAESFLEF